MLEESNSKRISFYFQRSIPQELFDLTIVKIKDSKTYELQLQYDFFVDCPCKIVFIISFFKKKLVHMENKSILFYHCVCQKMQVYS